MTNWDGIENVEIDSEHRWDPFLPTYRNIPVENTSDQDRKVTLDDLSPDQKKALDAIVDLAKSSDVCTLAGWAGTGKSTLIPIISETLEDTGHTAFCAFTGKAANVLERKMHAAGVRHYGYCGTVHRLIYKPITDGRGRIIRWTKNEFPLTTYDGTPIRRIILDEASMISEQMLDDLRYYEVPIIAVGDPGQLPPVKAQSAIEHPDVTLEKIHRQAENNPIIQLAHRIRTEGDLPRHFPQSEHVRFHPKRDIIEPIAEGFERLGLNFGILVRRNQMRNDFNLMPRSKELLKTPEEGDIVICLKNAPPVYNGMRGIIDSIKPYKKHWYIAEVRFPDDGFVVKGAISKHQFGIEYTINDKREVGLTPNDELGLLFDFGISLTVHKSQGSAFEECVLIPERWSSDEPLDYQRWLYTAVTRAAHRITIAK